MKEPVPKVRWVRERDREGRSNVGSCPRSYQVRYRWKRIAEKREEHDGEGRERILDCVYSSSLPLGINSSPRIT